MRAIVSLFVVVVLAVGVVWIWPRLESDPPVLTGPERIELGAGERQIDVAWEDPGMGLAEVAAVLRLPGTPGEGEIIHGAATFAGEWKDALPSPRYVRTSAADMGPMSADDALSSASADGIAGRTRFHMES